MKTVKPEVISDAGLRYAQSALEEMKNETDRAAAILLGAELDDMLLQILTKRLLMPRSKNSRLLQQDAPLGSFSARIEMVSRLGLIHPVVHHELHLIRRVRNEFAHKRSGFTFKTQPVSQLALELAIPKAIALFLSESPQKHGRKASAISDARGKLPLN